MISALQELDRNVLFWINPGLSNPVFDFVFPVFREKLNWIPVYIWLIYHLYSKQRENFWYIILSIVVLVLLTDQLSSGLLKPWIGRLRPCHQPGVMEQLHRVLDSCGGQFGFVSSHAANHFGLSAFLFWITGKKVLNGFLLFSWAGLVAFSQVYCGVHYPGDAVCGALLGFLAALMVFKVYFRFTKA